MKTNDAGESTSISVDETLQQRGNRYGKFSEHARISVNIKEALRDSRNWGKLEPNMQEALDMVAHKVARILNGDPNYDDSWIDASAYLQLVVKKLHGEDI